MCCTRSFDDRAQEMHCAGQNERFVPQRFERQAPVPQHVGKVIRCYKEEFLMEQWFEPHAMYGSHAINQRKVDAATQDPLAQHAREVVADLKAQFRMALEDPR